MTVNDEVFEVVVDVGGKLTVDDEDVEVAVDVGGEMTVDDGDVTVAVDIVGFCYLVKIWKNAVVMHMTVLDAGVFAFHGC